MRITDKRILIAYAVLVLFALWLGGRLPWIMVQIFSVTLILDLSWLAVSLRACKASLELSSPRFYAGQSHDFKLRVALLRKIPIWGELLADGCLLMQPHSLSIRPNKPWSISSSVHFARRGRRTIGPLRLRTHSPFHLWVLEQTILPPRDVAIYPSLSVADPGTHNYTSVQPASGRGRPRPTAALDIYDVRPYSVGDSPQRIHWKLSAHHGQLYVRKEEVVRRGSLIIILDCFPLATAPDLADRDFEAAVSLTARLAADCIRQRQPVSLAAWGAGCPPLLANGQGQHSMYDRVMKWLAELPSHDELKQVRMMDDAFFLTHSVQWAISQASRAIYVTAHPLESSSVRQRIRSLSSKISLEVRSLASPREASS